MKKNILSFAIALLFALSAFSQTRVVLIEQFTNSSCPPCGAVSPAVYAFANTTPNVAVIAYHTLFPYSNDSMYFENPVEANQRVNFYSVAGVPNSILDGNVYNGSTNPFVSTISTFVNNRLNVAPRYTIESSSLTLVGNKLTGSFKFTSLSGMNTAENLAGHVVIIEKNVLKSSYAASPGANNETEYGYVMRKMIPNASGTSLSNTQLNGSDSVNLDWTLSHIKNRAELRIVAFVQNVSTREVYQAALFSVSESPLGLATNSKPSPKARLYPNPAKTEFTLSFPTSVHVQSLIISDQWGRTVCTENLNVYTDFVSKRIDLKPGIYSVGIHTANGHETQKLIVTE